jgi:SAM-dependent methyltransferase
VGFVDLFSAGAEGYAAARPRYPDALFDAVAAAAPGRERAWDCACGNGQAALGLAQHFAEVEATDASAAQIEQALPHERVRYRVQPAERTSFTGAYFDAIVVAQALHWFDHALFFAEALRVLKPGGVCVAWGYDRFHVNPEFDAAFERSVRAGLAPWWAPQNALLWKGYRDVPWPFEPLAVPAASIEADWTLHELLAYALTWSAARRRIEADGTAWFEAAADELRGLWGNPEVARRVSMPLHILGGRRAANNR